MATLWARCSPPSSGKFSTDPATPSPGQSSSYVPFHSFHIPYSNYARQATYVLDIVFILILRWYLVRENNRRDAEHAASGKEYDEFGYVEHTQEDGSIVKLKVPIQFLDITDRENKAFRYPL